MTKNLSICIPDSSVSDCSDLRSKTEKLFDIAHIAAVFKVKKIIVFHDPYMKPEFAQREIRTMKDILAYVECPQYLRKRLFPLTRNLTSVGVLPPLATHHHVKSKELKHLEVRPGALFMKDKVIVADVGGSQYIDVINPPHFSLKTKVLRAPIKIIEESGKFIGEVLNAPPRKKYWGYKLVTTKATLPKLLSEYDDYKIATSRSCEYLPKDSKLEIKNNNVMVVFGSPLHGIPNILRSEKQKMKDHFDVCYNIMQNYGTRSIRLKEAILMTLTKLFA